MYTSKIKARTESAPKTLGNMLGRWAVYLDFDVKRVSMATGATRQTIYNWFGGGEVIPAYRERVKQLISVLEKHKTAEAAWRDVCRIFNIRN